MSKTKVIDSVYDLTGSMADENINDDVVIKVGAYALKRMLTELSNNSSASAKGFSVVTVAGNDTIVLTLNGLKVTVTK